MNFTLVLLAMIPGRESLCVLWVWVDVADVPLDVIVIRVEPTTLGHRTGQGPTWNGFDVQEEDLIVVLRLHVSFLPQQTQISPSVQEKSPVTSQIFPRYPSREPTICCQKYLAKLIPWSTTNLKNQLNWRAGGETNFNRLIDWNPMNDRIWYFTLRLGQVCPRQKKYDGTHICCSWKSFVAKQIFAIAKEICNKFARQLLFGNEWCLGQNEYSPARLFWSFAMNSTPFLSRTQLLQRKTL